MPPPAEPPPVYREVVEEGTHDPYRGADALEPLDPARPPAVAPWARSVWFWLLVLGVLVATAVVILLAVALGEDGRRDALLP